MTEKSRAQHGEMAFFSVDVKGILSPLSRLTGERESYSMVIPASFGGSSRTDLLFYDQQAGEADLCFVDHRGNLERIHKHTGWRKTWSHIVPGSFSEDPWAGLLFYDRESGDLELSRTDGLGRLLPLATFPGWRPGWDIIVPGRFAPGDRTDLLFYNRHDGTLALYCIGERGNLEILRHYSDQFWDWDAIVALSMRPTRLSELLCYSRRERMGRLYSVEQGGWLRHVKTHRDWSRGWDLITPLPVRGSDTRRVLFYDRSIGFAQLIDLDDDGEPRVVRKYEDWKKTWCTIVPGQYTPDGVTDLMFYDRFADFEEADKARHALGCRYEVLGSMDGPLGVPAVDLNRAGNGWVRRFLAGDIYWRSDINANEVYGQIREHYRRTGGPDGPLGLPTSIPKRLENQDVTYQSFDGGIVVLGPDGTSEVKHAVMFRLDNVAQKLAIRDGPSLRNDTHNAELALYITVRANGNPLPGMENLRIPKQGHLGPSAVIDLPIRVPLNSGLRLEVLVKAFDVDLMTHEDYLGTWRMRYEYDRLISKCLAGGEHVEGEPIHEFESKTDPFEGKETLEIGYSLDWAD